MTANRRLFNPAFSPFLALVALTLACSTAFGQTEPDPPARVANLSHVEGSVALAPAGETEWSDAEINRPITRGDRLWVDRGGRAELHLGSAVVHLDGQTLVDVTELDDQAFQASLNQGTVNARVRQLEAGENFELDTPQLALRATQPGDLRVDVDPARGTTRVTVHSGGALVYGAGGESLQVQAGQQIGFTGRNLQQIAVPASLAEDGFDRWAADHNRLEDQSVAARHVPREVVGYQQLDPYGNWSEDPGYGAIWYPTVTVADWAPYRYGHWVWIAPWGWTWIDDAPWGFAPFHYGRWALIGARWAWVPGRIGPRPVYAPALVAFVGGGNFSLTVGSGPGIAWFPLAPGEAWRPAFRSSPVYLRNANRNIVVNNARGDFHTFQRRPEALTALRVDDFSRGRPAHGNWKPVSEAELARAQIVAPPSRPGQRRPEHTGRAPARPQSPALAQVPVPPLPAQVPAPVGAGRAPSQPAQEQVERARRDQQAQQERMVRERQAQQDRAQRELQLQAQRQQQAARQQANQERAQHQLEAQQHAAPQRQTPQPPAQLAQPQGRPAVVVPAAPAVLAQPAAPHRGEGRERGPERKQGPESRDEDRSKGR